DRNRLPEQPLGGARVVAEGLHHHPDLAAGVADRLSRVAGLQPRELLVPGLDRVAEAAHDRCPVRRADRPPSGVGGLGARDRGVDLLRPRPRPLLHPLLVRRLDPLDHVLPPPWRSGPPSARDPRAASTRASITLLSWSSSG